MRVRELGERWESPAEPSGGGGDGGGVDRDERQRSATEGEQVGGEQDGGAASGGKRKHKDRHKEKHRHRERDEGETQKRSRADEGLRCGCSPSIRHRRTVFSVLCLKPPLKQVARGLCGPGYVHFAMTSKCHEFPIYSSIQYVCATLMSPSWWQGCGAEREAGGATGAQLAGAAHPGQGCRQAPVRWSVRLGRGSGLAPCVQVAETAQRCCGCCRACS